jgi:hypothetical protein
MEGLIGGPDRLGAGKTLEDFGVCVGFPVAEARELIRQQKEGLFYDRVARAARLRTSPARDCGGRARGSW